MQQVLSGMSGSGAVVAERVSGAIYIDIDIDRDAASRYGVNVADMQGSSKPPSAAPNRPKTSRAASASRSRSAICATSATAPGHRPCLIAGPDGEQIPALAEVEPESFLRRPLHDQQRGRVAPAIVYLNVKGSDMGGYVDSTPRSAGQELNLPAGYYVALGRRVGEPGTRQGSGSRSSSRSSSSSSSSCSILSSSQHWRRHGDALRHRSPCLAGCSSSGCLGYNFSVGGLGRLHRTLRHRGGNRRGDGRLPP